MLSNKQIMVQVQRNNNSGYLVSFVEIYLFFIVTARSTVNKDHQHDDDDEYDYECVGERKK
jgi:hypothetical protein